MKIKLPKVKIPAKYVGAIRKASPEIALVLGLVGVAGTTVFACRQTLKIDKILEPHKKDIQEIHRLYTDGNLSEKEKNHAVIRTWLRTGWDVTKLFGPVLLTELTSLGLVLFSHQQLRVENQSLSVALSSVTAAFAEYRSRVRGDLGDDIDKKFRYNAKSVDVTREKENGEEETVTIDNVVQEFSTDIYKRWFNKNTSVLATQVPKIVNGMPCKDEYGNPKMVQDVAMDIVTLKEIAARWNNIKNSRKSHVVYLNEVLADLCFDLEDYGQDVGWRGDSVIDFRPEVVMMLDERGFETATIALDFNCDGCVRDEVIKKPKRKALVRAKRVAA